MPRRRLVAIGLLLLVSGGCAEAGIATAGAMVGLAAGSINTGADVYGMGKLDATDMVAFEEQVAAVRAAAEDLELTLEKDEVYEPGRWRCTLADDRETRVRIYLDRRTSRLCRTRVDVGVFGSKPTARLILLRIRTHAKTISQWQGDSL